MNPELMFAMSDLARGLGVLVGLAGIVLFLGCAVAGRLGD